MLGFICKLKLLSRDVIWRFYIIFRCQSARLVFIFNPVINSYHVITVSELSYHWSEIKHDSPHFLHAYQFIWSHYVFSYTWCISKCFSSAVFIHYWWNKNQISALLFQSCNMKLFIFCFHPAWKIGFEKCKVFKSLISWTSLKSSNIGRTQFLKHKF